VFAATCCTIAPVPIRRCFNPKAEPMSGGGGLVGRCRLITTVS
jgi:hypothetical protein